MKHSILSKKNISVLFLLSFVLCASRYGLTATYCVDDFVDGPPNAADCPVDCVTANGNCSLRDAIQAANANGNLDTIEIPTGTIILSEVGDNEEGNTAGDLDLNTDMILQGTGMNETIVEWSDQLSNMDKDRIFHVDPQDNGAKVVINDLTAQKGMIFDQVVSQDGGAGISQNLNSTLELRRVKIKDNIVDTIGGDDEGGGIQANGMIEIYQSSIEGNQSSGGGAGMDLSGPNGDLIMEDSTVSGNRTTEGGIGAGGLFLRNLSNWSMTNSTISNNECMGSGGGLLSDGTGTMTNVTVTENTAASSGGGIRQGGVGGITLKNTIVAANTAGDNVTDCNAPFANLTSAGSNLIGDGTDCMGVVNGVMNDQVGTGASPINPLLGPLENNGGLTQTHNLLEGSPAREGVSLANCPPPNQDQRGQSRPLGGLCDIGAVEVGSSDLAVALALDPSETVETNEPVFVDVDIDNLGPDENFGVTLVIDLPAGTQVNSIIPQTECELIALQVICFFNSLANGDFELVTLDVVFTQSGDFLVQATVTGSADDPNPDNNMATQSISVTAAPGGGGCSIHAPKAGKAVLPALLTLSFLWLVVFRGIRGKKCKTS